MPQTSDVKYSSDDDFASLECRQTRTARFFLFCFLYPRSDHSKKQRGINSHDWTPDPFIPQKFPQFHVKLSLSKQCNLEGRKTRIGVKSFGLLTVVNIKSTTSTEKLSIVRTTPENFENQTSKRLKGQTSTLIRHLKTELFKNLFKPKEFENVVSVDGKHFENRALKPAAFRKR